MTSTQSATARRDAELERWRAIHQDLRETVAGLSETERTDVRNPDGWSVKDHLAHVLAWQQSVIPFLDKQPRHIALGVPESLWQARDFDAMNAIIHERLRDEPFETVWRDLEAVYEQLVARIAALTEEQLREEYGGAPLVDHLEGKTWDHESEHLGYIVELVGSR